MEREARANRAYEYAKKYRVRNHAAFDLEAEARASHLEGAKAERAIYIGEGADGRDAFEHAFGIWCDENPGRRTEDETRTKAICWQFWNMASYTRTARLAPVIEAAKRLDDLYELDDRDNPMLQRKAGGTWDFNEVREVWVQFFTAMRLLRNAGVVK